MKTNAGDNYLDEHRYTTEESACYFSTYEELIETIEDLSDDKARIIGNAMFEVAKRRYTWTKVGRAYFDLIEDI